MTSKQLRKLLDRCPALRHPCDLDVLRFLWRHPRSLLRSDQLAAYVGYDVQQVGKSLEALIGAGLVHRSQNPTHQARMYSLNALGGAGGSWWRPLLELAETRQGRREIIQALRGRDLEGPRGEPAARIRSVELKEVAHA